MPGKRDLDPGASPLHFFGAEVRRARGNGGNCIEVGAHPDTGRVLVRDTRDRGGPALRLPWDRAGVDGRRLSLCADSLGKRAVCYQSGARVRTVAHRT